VGVCPKCVPSVPYRKLLAAIENYYRFVTHLFRCVTKRWQSRSLSARTPSFVTELQFLLGPTYYNILYYSLKTYRIVIFLGVMEFH
jgi:hypothetical protein